MRKSKINLIISRQDYQKYEDYFFWVRASVIIFVLVFLISFFALFISIKKSNDTNAILNSQKKTLLEGLKNKNGDEAKIYFLQQKYADLTNFLKDDAFSAPYYSLLTNALKDSSQSSTLRSFAISKNRDVSFTIEFKNFPDLLSFFKFIESQQFLKNFENISLKSFSVIGQADQQENYELSFAGTFIKISGK